MTKGRAQVPLDLDLKPLAMLLAWAYGATWGLRGNLAELLLGVATRRWLLVPNAGYGDAADSRMEAVLGRLKACSGQFGFIVSYTDSEGTQAQVKAFYGQIEVFDSRMYLSLRTVEPVESSERALAYNLSIEIDRVQSLVPHAETPWIDGLQKLSVSFELIGEAAIAGYQKQAADLLLNRTGSIKKPRLKVMRNVSNLDWVKRELLSYGKDCEVERPPQLRQQIAKELSAAAAQYQKK